MNIQKIFNAVKEEPDLSTIHIVVYELEKQGYTVIVDDKYKGLAELDEADERGDLIYLPYKNGIKLTLICEKENQEFKVHNLDNDRICFTSVDSLPVMLNPEYTVDLYKSN